MKDPIVHLLLLVLVAFAIVAMGTLFGESDDARAARVLPRRLLTFLLGCALLIGLLLLAEHTVASVS